MTYVFTNAELKLGLARSILTYFRDGQLLFRQMQTNNIIFSIALFVLAALQYWIMSNLLYKVCSENVSIGFIVARFIRNVGPDESIDEEAGEEQQDDETSEKQVGIGSDNSHESEPGRRI